MKKYDWKNEYNPIRRTAKRLLSGEALTDGRPLSDLIELDEHTRKSVPGVPFEASFTAPYLTSYNKYMDEGKIRPWIYQRLKAGAQTIIGESIQGYFAGTMTEDEVIEEMDTRYDDLLNGQ